MLWVIDGIRVFRLRLDDRSEGTPGTWTLSPDERSRASALLDDEARRRFVQVRVALREVLGATLGQSPASIQIRTGSAGKPHVPALPLWFSVSHTRAAALIAVTGLGPVGVDLQGLRRGQDPLRLARRFFDPSETRVIASLPAPQALDAFLRAWTAKEAVLKALGIGIWDNTSSVVVDLEADGKLQLLAVPGRLPAERWSLIEASAGSGARAAVAIPRAGIDVRDCHRVDLQPVDAAASLGARNVAATIATVTPSTA